MARLMARLPAEDNYCFYKMEKLRKISLRRPCSFDDGLIKNRNPDHADVWIGLSLYSSSWDGIPSRVTHFTEDRKGRPHYFSLWEKDFDWCNS
ncbi:hypothetical protein ACLOJK_021006, partial [Asimina triloba]